MNELEYVLVTNKSVLRSVLSSLEEFVVLDEPPNAVDEGVMEARKNIARALNWYYKKLNDFMEKEE